MKNLLKKTVSILIALTILLCAMSTFAEEATETGEAYVPTFEVGSGMGGTLQPDAATEIRVHAGKRGRVQFTLTLAEDCGVSVAVNGGGVSLTRPDGNLPVYTFISRLEWDESKILSMTANRTVGYSISSELIPEEPAEEPVVPEENTEAAQEEPAPIPESVEEPAEEPAEEPVAAEESTEPEPQEPAAAEEESAEEPAAPAEETEPEAEPGDPGQSPEPEAIPEAADTVDQPIEEQPIHPEEQEAEQSAAEEQESAQPESENAEGATDSVEIIIAKSLTPNESWNGTVRKKKPTILKLDVVQPGVIHMFVEGKDVLYSVQKSDRITDDAGYTLTDAETNRSITSWDADPGSYLISLKAGENSMGARVAVSFKNDAEFAAWEEEQAALEAEEQGEQEDEIPEETEGETEETPEEETETESENDRSVKLKVSWDTDDPDIGSTAHVVAELFGYEGIDYSLQWQNSPDAEHWTDVTGETGDSIDVTLTEENNNYCWRVVVYVEKSVE